MPLRFLGLVGLIAAVGCGKPAAQVQAPEPPTVTFAHPVQRKLQPWLEFNGRTEAVDAVDIVPEVTGEILKVHFKAKEGQLVDAGELLYTINPVPYVAAVDRATADIKNWETQLVTADNEYKRLLSTGESASKTEVDKAKAAVGTSTGNLGVSKAELAKAQFNLDKTKIKAPIRGRIGRTEKTEGNVISPMTARLARITSVAPIYALWDVDEQTSLFYRRMIYIDKTIPNPSVVPLKCWIKLKSDTGFAREGTINFIDPEVSRASASRPLRGTFLNPDGFITPGDTVRVRIDAGPTLEGILIPEVAVFSQQAKKFVYVLNAADEAMLREVEPGELRDGLQIITKGVTPEDRVVVNGLLRIRPGVKVKPVLESQPTSLVK